MAVLYFEILRKIENVSPLDLNEAGEMVLRAAGLSDEYYFTKTGESLTKLVDQDGRPIKARRLNNKGQIIGALDDNIVLWQDGKSKLVCPGFPGGLNDHGDIAGIHDGRAFLIRSGERVEGPPGSHVFGINNSGFAVGEVEEGQPATWDGQDWNILNKAEGYKRTVACMISDSGLICGYCENEPEDRSEHGSEVSEDEFDFEYDFWTNRQLVVWDGAEAHVLAHPHPIVCPMDLNDRGDIVGWFEDWDYNLPIVVTSAFLLTGENFLNLDGMDGEYSFYRGAYAINNSGMILAMNHDDTVLLRPTTRA
jgi:hypothetical protein